jgi:serpin B
MTFQTMTCEAPLPESGVCPIGNRIGERCVAYAKFVASAKLKTVNALMLSKASGSAISPAYIDLLREHYRAEVFRGAGLGEINGWVSRQTEGRITQILDQAAPDLAAAILNAVYFKAEWRVWFTKGDTREDDFNLTPTDKVKVATMHREGRFAVLRRPGYRAIRLPFKVDALSMVIVLPDDVAGATALARELDAAKLAALFAELKGDTQLKLALPRFKTSFAADLKAPFMQAGMIRAFDMDRADFSAMTAGSDARLAIGAVAHRAVIDVNEVGTEAAAATLVAIRIDATWARDEPFVVDRPFLFYIADDTTGAILFQGRISDPRPQ